MTESEFESLRAEFRPRAENQVKLSLVLDKIAELEALELSEGELDAEYSRLAQLHNISREEAEKSTSPEALKQVLLAQKAIDLVKETAVKE